MDTGLLVSGLAGLISGFLGSGKSPQEDEVRKIMDKLYEEVDWIKQLPFSKEELMKGILPQVQKTFRGAADVAAGKIGATIPEVSGAPQGQSFMEYYTQALAPEIAKGEELAGNAQMDFTKMYADMETNAKSQTLDAYKMLLGGAEGLPNTTGGQRFFMNFLQGAQMGSTAYGNVGMADALKTQAEGTSKIADMIMGQNGKFDLMKLYQSMYNQQSLGIPATPKIAMGRK